MGLPNVNIKIGNGNLGRTAATSDGVAGMVLTGTAVAGKLELNKHYQLSSTRDLTAMGMTPENNALIDKEVRAFYFAAGEGAELHLVVVAVATTLTQMCAAELDSPLAKLIDGAGGRIKIVGVNKLPGSEYTPTITQGIDGDAITAAAAAHASILSFAKRIMPFRLLMPAPAWSGTTDTLYKPTESSYNTVRFILASDDPTTKTAAIGQVLGRNAILEPQQSDARVKSGAIATNGWFTNGKTYLELSGLADSLHDAGYTFYRSFPMKNGCYLNGNAMAAPISDDYSDMHLGRVIDKATVLVYAAYVEEICDNIILDKDGKISAGACKSYEGIVKNAVNAQMSGQISDFSAYVDPSQNILSTGVLEISCKIVPLGTIKQINVNLAFSNPQSANA